MSNPLEERPQQVQTQQPSQTDELWRYADTVLPGAIVFTVSRHGMGCYHTSCPVCGPDGIWRATHGGKSVQTGLGTMPASEGTIYFIRPGAEELVKQQKQDIYGPPRQTLIPDHQLNPQSNNVPKDQSIIAPSR